MGTAEWNVDLKVLLPVCGSLDGCWWRQAEAQVAVANHVFLRVMGKLREAGVARETAHFLFCPTEYCAALVADTVEESQYLTTLGRELIPEVRPCARVVRLQPCGGCSC